MAPVLDIKDLSTHIKLTSSVVQAVGNVDMQIEAGETLGIVGESGSGKSAASMAIMGLLPRSAQVTGSIRFRGRELLSLSDQEMRPIRGREIAVIFQDALASLNPMATVFAFGRSSVWNRAAASVTAPL